MARLKFQQKGRRFSKKKLSEGVKRLIPVFLIVIGLISITYAVTIEERKADVASVARAKSEARQLRREARAKYIKEREGKFTPLSERLKQLAPKQQTSRMPSKRVSIRSRMPSRRTSNVTLGLVRDPLQSDKPNPWVDDPRKKNIIHG